MDCLYIRIRYDEYSEDGTKSCCKFTCFTLPDDTMKDIKDRIIWDSDVEVYLIGYEASEESDEPIYDEEVQLHTVFKENFVLIFSNIPLVNDLK